MKPKITPEMKLGMKEFENTMFMLKAIPRDENINRFALQGNLIPERLDNIAWFLPAYLSADFNLFFVLLQTLIIVGQLVAHKFISRMIIKLQQ